MNKRSWLALTLSNSPTMAYKSLILSKSKAFEWKKDGFHFFFFSSIHSVMISFTLQIAHFCKRWTACHLLVAFCAPALIFIYSNGKHFSNGRKIVKKVCLNEIGPTRYFLLSFLILFYFFKFKHRCRNDELRRSLWLKSVQSMQRHISN